MWCRYGIIISEMLREIKEFNTKSHGRGPGGLPGGLATALIGGVLGSLAGGGGGGGGVGGLMSALMGGGASMGGQTPQLSSTEAFDLNMPMVL